MIKIIYDMKLLPKSFFARDAAIVARELLGKILVHKTSGGLTAGKIVETEAYYGARDPASRAYRNRRTPLSAPMWGPAGRSFVYMVHNNWLLNVVTSRQGKPSAVLIRALEPIKGKKLMERRRRKDDIKHLTTGPGKLTKAMGITKQHSGLDLTNTNNLFIVEGGKEKFRIASSHRIGVSQDLKRKLRFYIKGNEFVSK